jgi:hypothetical protein
MISAVIGTQGNAAKIGFAGGHAILAALDAVRDGIANEVHERIGNLLNDVVIEFGFASGEVQVHLFAGGFCSITNSA